MQCRICQSEMECQPRMDITYHECRTCGGLWLGGGALEAIIDKKMRIPFPKLPGENTQPSGTPTSHCPNCAGGTRLMEKVTYATSKVRLHGCPVCFGHWLTRKQVRQLINIVSYPFPIGLIRNLLGL